MICLNSLIDPTTRAMTMFLQVGASTPVVSSCDVVKIVSVRVSSVAPTPELEKALEAPTREHIQQVSDEAAFSRRAMAALSLRDTDMETAIAAEGKRYFFDRPGSRITRSMASGSTGTNADRFS